MAAKHWALLSGWYGVGGCLRGGLVCPSMHHWYVTCRAPSTVLYAVPWCSVLHVQINPSQPWLDDYFTFARARLSTFRPFDLAQTLYGAAKLRLALQPVVQPSGFAQQPTWLGPGPPTPSAASRPGPDLKANAQHADPAIMRTSSPVAEWMSAALEAAPQLLATANAQDLGNLSWALVQLRVPVQPVSTLTVAFAARLVSLAAGCDPSQLALGVWALGKWRARPSKSQLDRLELATFRQVQPGRGEGGGKWQMEAGPCTDGCSGD